MRLVAVVTAMLLQVSCGTQKTITLDDATGVSHAPLLTNSDQVIVLLFSSPDCPIANAIAPEIERLHQQTVAGDGRFYVVHARKDVTPGAAAEHARSYGITAAVLLDRDQELVRAMDATVTPELVVLKCKPGEPPTRVYQGRINNLYASLGNRRDRASKHWGRDAIAKAMAGEPIEPSYRQPLGCFLERSP